jgi:hypothetical protein
MAGNIRKREEATWFILRHDSRWRSLWKWFWWPRLCFQDEFTDETLDLSITWTLSNGSQFFIAG